MPGEVQMKSPKDILVYVGKLIAGGIAFLVGTAVTVAILTPFHLHSLALPAGASIGKSELRQIMLCPLLALGLAPLAAGLSGRYRSRWRAIAFLVFINLGVNTTIEAKFFTTSYAHGGELFVILMYAGTAAVFAAMVVGLFRPEDPKPALKMQRSSFGWTWRILLAVLAFPVIYFLFGMAVSPFVLAQYRAGVAGLVLPSLRVILPVEFVRSALFLLASLPAILLWSRSRWGLVLALGWAHAVTNGLYGLLSAYWFPTVLRVAHSIEITFDSFVYALVIVMLFKTAVAPPRAATTPGEVGSAAAV